MAAKPRSPVGFKEVCQLTQLGIGADAIKFKNVTLQSNKYVTVREEGKNSLAIVDTATKNVLRLPVQVDSAIMNPISKVVALRAGDNLQIYNLEMKSKMKSAEVKGVVFWKWISPKIIAVVTDAAVFHWSMDGNNEPKKIFDRAAYDGAVQIINYSASSDQKWLILNGIAQSKTGGGIDGVLQVFSVDVGASQPTMNAHAACFASVTIDGRDKPSNLFCFTMKNPAGDKLNIIEVGVPKDQAFKQSGKMKFQGADFPVAMLPDDKHGVVFVVSKAGVLFVYEVQSGKCIFAQQASKSTMFTSAAHEDDGIVTVDQSGRVSHFNVDEQNIVNYICQTLNDYDLGVEMAKRYNLPGAGDIFKEQFARLMGGQRYEEAMSLAAQSPQGCLRTLDTINAFKELPQLPGQNSPPLLQYFSQLLSKGKLNAVESLELTRRVLARQQGTGHIEQWLKKDQLECSEDLGDLLKNYDVKLALSIYIRANVPEKVIGCFLALGAREPSDDVAKEHFIKIFQYAKQISFSPDYPLLVHQLIRVSRDRAKDFALMLIRNVDGPMVDIMTLVNTFMSANDVKSTTNILLEYLKNRGDREEDGELQTKVLEINLMANPAVADAIMESDEYKLSHYDQLKIAQLCERAQLYQRALEHYTEIEDIKRCLANTHMLNPEFLLEYFGRMTPENSLDCLNDMMRLNMAQNIRLVVEVAKKWGEHLGSDKLIAMFEKYNSPQGLYFYLGSFVNFTEDTEVIFKYIVAAVSLQQFKEVERVCRDNDKYDPKQVKEFLLEKNLKDPRPLIHVCDRFDFVDELTRFLYSKGMFPFIEAYVQRMNPKATPTVLGTLLDMNANEEQIINLVNNIRPPLDDPTFVERLVTNAEEHSRLKILQQWLESRAAEKNEDPHLHNALAKIYVDTNNNPQQFLTTNKFYNSAVVGQYCEGRDPHLSFIAYKRAWGECDDQLIDVTNKNGFFKDQARYLVERQDLALWEKVLGPDNDTYKRQLIDQVVATALPESKVPEEVSTTVKAFMAANLPNELIELLERIILHGPKDGAFHKNKNLQNLLILTAIKADKQRVMDYINRLDNYDGPDIAKIAVSEQYQLYEEAFFIYKKFEKGPEAVAVLLDKLESLERAEEFAAYWDKADVWSLLANAQLQQGHVQDSIASYLKADDPDNYPAVINAAKQGDFFTELIDFLIMARVKVREPMVDNELAYAYAKTDRLADLEEFINSPNVCKIEAVGDICYQEDMNNAGRVLFSHIQNNAKLAMCLVKLGSFQEAVDAARRANAIPTWKAVCFSCVDAEKFRLAQMCGLNIIVYNDHMLDLIRHYETKGYASELIVLLEQGINLDRAHQGIYTQLGVLYAKYKEEKLMEHVKLFWSKLNIPTLLACCQQNQHWTAVVFLYTHYEQNDNAVNVMIDHSTEAWTHEQFKDIVKKVTNSDLFYRSITFYLDEHPMLLNDLLLDLTDKLEHNRVVLMIRQQNSLELIQKYLLHVQPNNLTSVNEAVNELYLNEEDYKSLRESIDTYQQFDQIALAQALETHELLQFRRISAYLYKMNKRYAKSMELSKKDEVWGDSMETAAESKDQELAEKLLRFFVEEKRNECFAACLFTCYELIRPDVVMEVAWRHGLMDFAMPFMIQSLRDYDNKLNAIQARLDKQSKKEADKDEEAKKQNEEMAARDAYVTPLAPLSIMPPPGAYGQPPMGGMGGPPMGMGMGGPPMGGGYPPQGGYPTPY